MTDRYLVLVRHAKAERPDGVADTDRPLTARGHGDSAAVGAWLARHAMAPDVVLCSPAKRTRQTWHGIALGMAESGDLVHRGTGAASRAAVHYDPVVYAGDAQDLLERVRAVDDEIRALLLVGHNPAVSLLSAALDPAGEPATDGLRTCGIAIHRAADSWRDWGSGTAVLEAVHTARG